MLASPFPSGGRRRPAQEVCADIAQVEKALFVLKQMEWFASQSFLTDTGLGPGSPARLPSSTRVPIPSPCKECLVGARSGFAGDGFLMRWFAAVVGRYDPVIFEGLSYDVDDNILQVSCDPTYLSEVIGKLAAGLGGSPCGVGSLNLESGGQSDTDARARLGGNSLCQKGCAGSGEACRNQCQGANGGGDGGGPPRAQTHQQPAAGGFLAGLQGQEGCVCVSPSLRVGFGAGKTGRVPRSL